MKICPYVNLRRLLSAYQIPLSFKHTHTNFHFIRMWNMTLTITIFFHFPSATARLASRSRCLISLCLNTRTFTRDSLSPRIKDAWLFSSDSTKSPSPRRPGRASELVAKPMPNTMADCGRGKKSKMSLVDEECGVYRQIKIIHYKLRFKKSSDSKIFKVSTLLREARRQTLVQVNHKIYD